MCGCEFIRTVKEKQSAAMPSNTIKCRQYALHYIELANGLTDADQRSGLLRFAATWAALADAIDRAQMIKAERKASNEKLSWLNIGGVQYCTDDLARISRHCQVGDVADWPVLL